MKYEKLGNQNTSFYGTLNFRQEALRFWSSECDGQRFFSRSSQQESENTLPFIAWRNELLNLEFESTMPHATVCGKVISQRISVIKTLFVIRYHELFKSNKIEILHHSWIKKMYQELASELNFERLP